ncbi:unnamed protein product [Cladocopium goreaui]|uniref:Uncharacterized protein n=1 Tax=Cladocopium goreaui TaxID=2562237 RepID=A0A9P1GJF4_9DINO|nr:unnamed protein product [Cladocopium goreaui]
MASDDDRDPGADSDALKRPAACIPKAKPKAKGPRPLKRPAACVSTSPDDEADAVLKKPAAGPDVAAAAPPAPAASPLPGCGGVTDTWEWVAVEGQQHLRECVIGDWKVREFIRKAGNLKGEKWRLFDHTPTEKTYKSLKQAVAAGFTPPDPKDVD